MGTTYKASIVIPVFNKWELTRLCLKSLAATLPAEQCEIIVIDNASTDETKDACPLLGSKLFGNSFVYHRCNNNSNFGPASNLGATLARGEYIIFLNNDTVMRPGWYEPLLNDFIIYSNIFATGPILSYPDAGPLGEMVQHLGVFITLTYHVGHLYEHLPIESPFIRKRRFFQCITAACMMIPKALFIKHGGFNENYSNGFEDIDLCARLWREGLRATINPKSRLIHHCSQTPGRHAHEKENSLLLSTTTLQYLSPDIHFHLQKDGLSLEVTAWGTLAVKHTEEIPEKLACLQNDATTQELSSALIRYPYWLKGYSALAELYEKRGDTQMASAVHNAVVRLCATPEYLLPQYRFQIANGQHVAAEETFKDILSYCKDFEYYQSDIASLKAWNNTLGLEDIVAQYQKWESTSEHFHTTYYLPFLKAIQDIAKNYPSPLPKD